MVRGAIVAGPITHRVTWAIPGDLATATGGYGYDRRIIAELKALGWALDIVELGEGFPHPTPMQKAAAEQRLRSASGSHPIVIDGLAFGVLPEIAAMLHRARPVVALIHHPLALETGLTDTQARRLHEAERAALVSTQRVVTTSRWTADLLATGFGVPRGHLAKVLPGTDRVPFSTGSGEGPPHLLSVGAVSERKAFDILVEALAGLADLPWRLTIAGDRTRDAAAVARLDRLIARHRLQGRIATAGAVSSEQLATLYAKADLFVLASRFEGYGMAFAEAIAHGLAVVGTTGGAIPATVPAAASRLVPPGEAAALSAALRALLTDDGLRRSMARAAREAAARLPTWAESGAAFSDLLATIG